MKKKVKAKKENGERWLLTYSDMITLLLALFILLYGMSNTDAQKMEHLAEGLNKSLGDGNGVSIFEGDPGIMDNNGDSMLQNNNGTNEQTPNSTTSVTPEPTQAASGDGSDTLTTEEEMNNLQNAIDTALDNVNAQDGISTAVEEGKLTITLKDDAFFDSGSADLKTTMKKGLQQLAKMLNRVNNEITIDGYTDNLPISSSDYPSNWQLSTARSSAVAQYLIEEEGVDSSRITAAGHAENDPIASNSSREGRSKNRRVTITIQY